MFHITKRRPLPHEGETLTGIARDLFPIRTNRKEIPLFAGARFRVRSSRLRRQCPAQTTCVGSPAQLRARSGKVEPGFPPGSRDQQRNRERPRRRMAPIPL